MGTMERILRLMAEKKASDVYLSAQRAGHDQDQRPVLPINNQLLPPDAPRAAAGRSAAGRASIEELDDTGELNMAHAIDGVGQLPLLGACASAARSRRSSATSPPRSRRSTALQRAA